MADDTISRQICRQLLFCLTMSFLWSEPGRIEFLRSNVRGMKSARMGLVNFVHLTCTEKNMITQQMYLLSWK